MEQDIKDSLRFHGARYNKRECALQVFVAGRRVTVAYGGTEPEALAVAVDRLSEVWAVGMTTEEEVEALTLTALAPMPRD